MKLKHSKDGDVKLTISAEQAEDLLSILFHSCALEHSGMITERAHVMAHEVEDALLEAGFELPEAEPVH